MTTAPHRKLGLKDKYGLLTRGLGWDTSYVPMDKVFPHDSFEGIKIFRCCLARAHTRARHPTHAWWQPLRHPLR